MAKRGKFPWFGLAVIIAALGAAAAAYAGARQLGDPAPLGIPLPAVPRLYAIIPREDVEQTSVIAGRMPEALLEQLAEQPDGVAPLKYRFRCDLGDFSLRHPYATTSVATGPEEAIETGVLLRAEFMYDQSVKKAFYSIPFRHEGETVPTYVSRTRFELEKAGAKFYDDVSPLALEGYRFEHYEYDDELADGTVVSHFVFIGPFGKPRVLSLDFMTTPELHELARPLVWKIMKSFSAGYDLMQGALKYDEEYIRRNELDGGPAADG
jgi:hypothetical protein